ncbi:hypothetical protein EAD96_00960, partial [Micromonospora sp. BL1]
MAKDHEEDLTLHDLIEGPTRDLTSARAAALAQTNARPASGDHEVDGTSGDPQGSQLHDQLSEGAAGRRRAALDVLRA